MHRFSEHLSTPGFLLPTRGPYKAWVSQDIVPVPGGSRYPANTEYHPCPGATGFVACGRAEQLERRYPGREVASGGSQYDRERC